VIRGLRPGATISRESTGSNPAATRSRPTNSKFVPGYAKAASPSKCVRPCRAGERRLAPAAAQVGVARDDRGSSSVAAAIRAARDPAPRRLVAAAATSRRSTDRRRRSRTRNEVEVRRTSPGAPLLAAAASSGIVVRRRAQLRATSGVETRRGGDRRSRCSRRTAAAALHEPFCIQAAAAENRNRTTPTRLRAASDSPSVCVRPRRAEERRLAPAAAQVGVARDARGSSSVAAAIRAARDPAPRRLVAAAATSRRSTDRPRRSRTRNEVEVRRTSPGAPLLAAAAPVEREQRRSTSRFASKRPQRSPGIARLRRASEPRPIRLRCAYGLVAPGSADLRLPRRKSACRGVPAAVRTSPPRSAPRATPPHADWSRRPRPVGAPRIDHAGREPGRNLRFAGLKCPAFSSDA
jgi:hypothetical protein